MAACDKHRADPVKGYHHCAGCEIESLQADLKLAQAQRDAGNREIERLRDLLACRSAEGHSHQCRACFHPYTPAEGESEDCPRCGSDGRD